MYRHPLSDDEAREVIAVLQSAGISNKVIRDVLADLGYHPDDAAYGSQGAYQFLDKTWTDGPPTADDPEV